MGIFCRCITQGSTFNILLAEIIRSWPTQTGHLDMKSYKFENSYIVVVIPVYKDGPSHHRQQHWFHSSSNSQEKWKQMRTKQDRNALTEVPVPRV